MDHPRVPLRKDMPSPLALRPRPWRILDRLNGFRFRPVRKLPAGPHEMAGVAIGVALQIILMLRFGLPEGTGRRQLGHHLAGPEAGGLDIGDGVFADALLLLARVENRGAVACARRRCPAGCAWWDRGSGRRIRAACRKLMIFGSNTISIASAWVP